MSRYGIQFYDDSIVGGLTHPHENPVSYDRLADAVREAGDLIQNGVADEAIVRDNWNMVLGSRGFGLYINFDVVAHIVARDVEPRAEFPVYLLDVTEPA